MALGYARLRYESSAVGNESVTPTYSTKTLDPPLIEFGMDPGVEHLRRNDENRNTDEPLQPLPEKYAGSWNMLARMYPDLIGFVLKWALGAPVTTAGNGVITDPDGTVIPAGCHRHVWDSSLAPWGDGANTQSPQTVDGRIGYVDQGVFLQCKGMATQEVAFQMPDSGGARVTASGLMTFFDDIADPSITPTFESLAIPPFMRQDLALVTWLSGTGTSEDWDCKISTPIEPLRTLGIASAHPDLIEKGDDPILVSGTIRKRGFDVDDWNALIASTRFAIKARWTSDAIIAGSYPYKMWLEGDGAQYMGGGPQALANRRRIGAEFPWELTSDGAGAAAKFTLVNATTSYA